MQTTWWTTAMAEARPEEMPILAHTRQELAGLLADERAPRRWIGLAVMSDPALALRVLQRANAVKHRHFRVELSSLEDAAQMLGTQTLARMAGEADLAEDVLPPERLAAYRRGSGRALLGALLALDWAELDRDRFPTEVSLAALLNNLGELFLLAHGDARIKRYLELVDSARVYPNEAEYVALGESLEDLGLGLATQWGLPEMVRESMRTRNARHTRTLCVMLATQVASHACSGWRHPSQPADLRLAARLLDLDISTLVDRINGVLGEFNRRALDYGLSPLAALSGETEGEDLDGSRLPRFCLAPRQDDYQVASLALQSERTLDREVVIKILLRGLHRGLGLNRVVFAAYDPEAGVLTAEHLVGTDFEPGFNRFRLALDQSGLFGRLREAPFELWLNDENRAELLARVPSPVKDLTGVDGFFARSLWVGGHPIGLVYADRRAANCALDARGYQGFLRLIAEAESALETLRQPGRGSTGDRP
ncbi:HDOD domain-containing protein [Thiocystis violacea]|uniref:HDOD domain-containing protein n=1 Tax=Thiocystis violacea TaxID=13725 RepID=UPI0030B8955C